MLDSGQWKGTGQPCSKEEEGKEAVTKSSGEGVGVTAGYPLPWDVSRALPSLSVGHTEMWACIPMRPFLSGLWEAHAQPQEVLRCEMDIVISPIPMSPLRSCCSSPRPGCRAAAA